MKYLSIEDRKEKIIEFCLAEYGHYADISDLSNIPLAYTTDGNNNDIQITIDIIKNIVMIECKTIIQYIPINNYFYCDIDFDDLVSWCMFAD